MSLTFHRVPAAAEEAPLKLRSVRVAIIPARSTRRFLEAVRRSWPLPPSLQHLKQVRGRADILPLPAGPASSPGPTESPSRKRPREAVLRMRPADQPPPPPQERERGTTEEPMVEVLVAPMPMADPAVEAALEKLLPEGGRWTAVDVPAAAPASREQWEAWRGVWPLAGSSAAVQRRP